jgi:hypothetical protein
MKGASFVLLIGVLQSSIIPRWSIMLELLQGQLPCPGFENWLFLDLFGIVLKNILFVQTFMITVRRAGLVQAVEPYRL